MIYCLQPDLVLLLTISLNDNRDKQRDNLKNCPTIFHQLICGTIFQIVPLITHHIISILKRDSGAKLNLAARSRGFCDDAELRRVDETARRPEVSMIERVEKLRPELELRLFRDIELPRHGQI
jgi:hypothetical protein